MPTSTPIWVRLARNRTQLDALKLLTLAIWIGCGLTFVISNVRSWQLEDADAYWSRDPNPADSER